MLHSQVEQKQSSTANAVSSSSELAVEKQQSTFHNTPRMVAQRQSIAAQFGSAANWPIQKAENRQGTTLDGITTNVDWVTGNLGGSVVGTRMVANPLGPDHTQGGPPQYGEQAELMGKLHTDPDESNENKYIRGHLLNDNVGGEGVAYNLFPITANANSQHLHKIEKQVKKWVNEEKQWVSYSVEVKGVDGELDNVKPWDNHVNSTFDCRAAVLDPSDMSEVKTVSALINSEFKKEHVTDPEVTGEDAALPGVGPEAGAHQPPQSSSKKEEYVRLDPDLFQSIKKAYQYGFLMDASELFGYINKVSGVGITTVDGYRTFINEAMQNANYFDDGVDESIRGAVRKLNKNAPAIIEGIDEFIAYVEAQETEEADPSYVPKGDAFG